MAFVMELVWDSMVTVGRVARAHGNRGQVIVNPETDFAERRFEAGRHVYLRQGDRVERHAIADVRFHRGRPIIALDGIASMDAAEGLAGVELRVPADELEALPEGTYYRHDLVGCRVKDASGREVGTVVRVEGPLERSLLVVDGAGVEVLVPLAAPICLAVDVGARTIVIDPPEGLLDLNA